jgi:hypothetical protein
VPGTKDHDGRGGAPAIGGVAPTTAVLESATVGWVGSVATMAVKGTAVGLVERRVMDEVNGGGVGRVLIADVGGKVAPAVPVRVPVAVGAGATAAEVTEDVTAVALLADADDAAALWA